jgi:drug/metabolite transporter (DMT)-like permease
LVVLSALLFAAGGNAVKQLFRVGYSPLTLAQMRIWWAFVWLLLALVISRRGLLRVSRRELPALAIFGCVGLAGVQLSYYLTIARINIAVALLIQYLGLAGVVAFERRLRQRSLAGQVWAALGMVLAGTFFAVGAYHPALLRVNLPGIGLGLISAVFFAFYILRASALASRINPWTILFYGFGCAGVMWAAFDVVTHASLPSDWRIWLAMALIGLIGTLVAHWLFLLALRTIRPSAAGIVATAEPVFAGLIAFIFLGDRLEPLQVLGALVIVAGIVTVQAGDAEPAYSTAAIQ